MAAAASAAEPEGTASGGNKAAPSDDGPTKSPANGTQTTPPPQTCATTEDRPSRSRDEGEAPPKEATRDKNKKDKEERDNPKTMAMEVDDFGLPIRRYSGHSSVTSGSEHAAEGKARSRSNTSQSQKSTKREASRDAAVPVVLEVKKGEKISESDSDEEDFKDAVTGQSDGPDGPLTPVPPQSQLTPTTASMRTNETPKEIPKEDAKLDDAKSKSRSNTLDSKSGQAEAAADANAQTPESDKDQKEKGPGKSSEADHSRQTSLASTVTTNGVSEFSHQQVLTKTESKGSEDGEWQEMPAYARYDMYNDDDKLIAREHNDEEEETYGYSGLGGAGKGYTRVLVDDDAESATSMDENTQYLFKDIAGTSMMDDDDQTRDAISQMQATKDLLTEGQRIAYVGVTRLELSGIVKDAEDMEQTRKTKKMVAMAAEATKMWAQKMMIRLYGHMEISAAEQIMIEQLAEHGVRPQDLTPALISNARVQNPMAADKEKAPRSSTSSGSKSPLPPPSPVPPDQEKAAEPPPAYEATAGADMPEVKTPSQLPSTSKLDIDLRWTVLCDLFLVLIADSVYDARSRCLLERVGKSLDIPWLDICRFEKRVTDALEMQQAAEKENWNEDQHMESRRKMALKRRYVMMGLATVGGGLVIGLSAGLLAPMIGAGLAAGFTTIGVSGTSGFLAGAGGAAIITSGAAASGSIIGGRAANRRTGAVKTFEYRPLHNNKRVNLIITVSGWMTGKVDDVRLPYSTVDSVMGDIYSVLWEPEMLRSMGDTINILATEALTQGLQQVLGSTILMTLMAALQLPIVLTKLSYLIDNPWAVSLDRATAAGLILADSLIDRNLGTRPVTLVGYSLGARVIFSCLQELARKGAYGLIQNVYMFGSPIVVKKDEYLRARAIVSGRFVNAYNRNDWILGYLFRLTGGGIRRVAGLAAIDDVPGMENMDVTELVPGHMEYRTMMPRLLRECGWLVESDEFTEIEDPDPENHQQRQRELINEIEEARKELEKEGKGTKGGAFSFFRKKKALERAEWEVYEDTLNKDGTPKTPPANGDANRGVLFDVDAIRAELAKERSDVEVEVKELESTLPPMRLDISANPSPGPSTPKPPATATPPKTPRDALRVSKSAEAVSYRSSSEAASRLSAERTPTYPTQNYIPSPTPSPYPYPAHNELEPEPEIQMTFDMDFKEEKKPPPPPPKDPYLNVVVPQPERPGAHSSKTTPNLPASNPWADPDDDDFGKEQEISMTFA